MVIHPPSAGVPTPIVRRHKKAPAKPPAPPIHVPDAQMNWQRSREIVERKIYDQLLLDRVTNRTIKLGGRRVLLQSYDFRQLGKLAHEMANQAVREAIHRYDNDGRERRRMKRKEAI